MAYSGQNTASQYWAQTDEIYTPLQYRFPEKLKAYVRRTFEDCEREARAEVMVELKQIITDAFNENVVWCLEWDKMPLPQETLAIKARAKEFAG